MDSLETIAARAGTDRGTIHSYLGVYSDLLGTRRLEPLDLLEIGVWEGCGLKTWLEYLPNAHIHGMDIRFPHPLPEWMNAEPRLTLHRCAQQDADQLWEKFRPGSLDVVIDDGSHYAPHQLISLHFLWPALRPGGLYFIEDVRHESFLPIFEMMPGYRVHNGFKARRVDDILVVMRKPEYQEGLQDLAYKGILKDFVPEPML